ncbi:DUF4129 domain-containing protein [Tautonia plasticadhaerens]|uniref:Protein-glutamine gamma-glutamyltransferase-like C-terminal domain-containing protein n=1 Tax=Tautonia plasticadhaerens TaxID=2527974 RepID=A0A518H033_9BACT|nr:DUF4129 domain-containing protein [Tautonia plasticadhaerens]QDV34200.1 hypothetical protein ElP_20850 [Tautonia plasticadhaerens]
MVSRRIASIAAASLLILLACPDASPARQGGGTSPANPEAVSTVREALSARSFPWYDAPADDFRPVMPPAPDAPPSNPSGGRPMFDPARLSLQELGRLIVFVLLATALTGLLLYVARTWRRRSRIEGRTIAPGPPGVAGSATRVESLPRGLEVDESEPLEAARLLRARGDRARAVVLLFAHQLLLLDRLGRIRLSPGRTGRQLVRSIEDDEIRRSVSRTLRQFEEVCYGHREPGPDAFDALWAEAEVLDARLSPGVTA